jgi:hypothetical protein
VTLVALLGDLSAFTLVFIHLALFAVRVVLERRWRREDEACRLKSAAEHAEFMAELAAIKADLHRAERLVGQPLHQSLKRDITFN